MSPLTEARRPALVLYTPRPAQAEFRQATLGMLPKVAQPCFARPIAFLSADLDAIEDVYPRAASIMFWRLSKSLAANEQTKRVRYVMYMEPDVVPIRPLWVELLLALLPPQADEFWAKGSAPRANIARMAPGPQGVFRRHINGNALYNVQDQMFANLVQRSRQAYEASLVYDVGLALAFANDSQRYSHRYVYSDFIINFGGQPIGIVEARRRFRCAVLLHGNMSKRYLIGLGKAKGLGAGPGVTR